MPKIRKKTSKRGSTRMREKVKHKVKESHKKAKRDAKKDVTWKSRVKKDIGIPSLFPYKEQVLLEQQQAKERKLAEKQVQRQGDPTASTSAAELAATINQNSEDDDEMDLDESNEGKDIAADPSLSSTSSLRLHAKSLRKVIMLSDVLIEVLDARDPLGTRSIQLERDAVRAGKKVVLVLNKVDLVPKENVEAWLVYLRRSWPTIPFKCSTQNQRNNLCSKPGNLSDNSSNASATQPLMHLLKNYARYTTAPGSSEASKIKSLASITVGVIGFPNVGKSSLINTLKRSKACSVAPTPGHTKQVQEIALEKGLKILDCPGVVIDSPGSESDPARILRNAVKIEQVLDPLGPIGIILDRCKAEHLMLLYNVPAFSFDGQIKDDRTKEFLIHVARSRGRVKKGGIPDLIGTARSVLRDWNAGRIPYYTVPPALPECVNNGTSKAMVIGQDQEQSEVGSAMILGELGAEFDLEGLFKRVDGEVLGSSKCQKEMGSVVRMQNPVMELDSGDGVEEVKLLGEIGVVDEDEDEEMDTGSANKRTVNDMGGPEIVSMAPKKAKQVSFDPTSSAEPNVVGSSKAAQLARMGIVGVGENKLIAKQARKDKKKAQKLAAKSDAVKEDEEMVPAPGQAVEEDEGMQQPYSFADFFQGTNAVARAL